MTVNEYDDLVGGFYQAAMDTSRWPAVARSIALVSGTDHAAVAAQCSVDPAYGFVFTSGVGTEDAATFQPHCLGLLMQYPGTLDKVVLIARPESVRFGGRFGHVYCADAVIGDGTTGRGVISLLRTEKSGPMLPTAFDTAARLAPHLGRALRVHRWRLAGGKGTTVLAGGNDTLPSDGSHRWRNSDKPLLVSRHGLTEREVDVCEQFLNLASVEATAAVLGVEVSTVRFHLKSIYAKTGQKSLPALMRFLVENCRAGDSRA